MLSVSRIIILIGLFSLSFSFPFGRKDQKDRIFTYETPDYSVYYVIKPVDKLPRAETDVMAGDDAVLEYKFVNTHEDKRLFDESGWLEIQFADSKGFVLARDRVAFEQLERGRQKFGKVTIIAEKAGKVKSVILRQLPESEVYGFDSKIETDSKTAEKGEPALDKTPRVDENPKKTKKKSWDSNTRFTNEDVEQTLKQFTELPGAKAGPMADDETIDENSGSDTKETNDLGVILNREFQSKKQ